MQLESLKEITEILKVLANENRLSIVCNLIGNELTVNEIHDKVSHISQPALSQHLAILKANKILKSNKVGLNITYSIKDERIVKIIGVLKDNYCNSKK